MKIDYMVIHVITTEMVPIVLDKKSYQRECPPAVLSRTLSSLGAIAKTRSGTGGGGRWTKECE